MTGEKHIDIMAIVNLTDDSFYAASRCDLDSVVARVGQFISEGATIIDFGACSTRPGSKPVGENEEWRRLEPALRAVREAYPYIPISVDTYWASVVERTYDLIGDFIVNDISAGNMDPLMLPTVGRLGLPYIAMHMKGTPEDMQDRCVYDDVAGEVAQYFREFGLKAKEHGISRWIPDPGFGFAKNLEQNYALMRNLSRLDYPELLVGVSRKSMVYKALGITPEESLPATQLLHLHALNHGATILRVHDVAEAARTVSIWRRLSQPEMPSAVR